MTTPRSALIFTAIFAAAVTGYAALSQARPAQKPPAKNDHEAERDIKIQWKHVLHKDQNGGSGDLAIVQVEDGDTIINADKAHYNQDAETVDVTGNPRMTDPQADGTCEKAFIEYGKSKKVATLTGNVTIIVKPKKKDVPPGPMPVSLESGRAVAGQKKDDSDSPRNYPATITCDKAVYDYDKTKKHAVLSGNLKIVQKLKDKTRTCTADTADWYGKEEKIVLHKPVHFEDTEGTKMEPEGDVTIITKEGEESIETGAGSGIFHVKPEKDKGDGSNPPAPAQESGKPATPGKKSPDKT